VAPRDALLYGTQLFAFATANEASAIELLGRTQADGGGHTGYNADDAIAPRTRLWGTFGYKNLSGDGTAATPHFHARGIAAQLGADTALGAAGRIGVAVGYDRQDFGNALASSGKGDTLRAALYTSQTLGAVGLSVVGGYARGDTTTRRETGLGRARVDRTVDQWFGGAQLALPLRVGTSGRIVPALGAIVSRVTGDDFAEGGSMSAAFRVRGAVSGRTSVSPFATLTAAHAIAGAGGVTWTPEVRVGYRHGAAGRNAVTLVAGDGTVFDGNRAALNADEGLIGAGLTVHKGAWTAFATYRGQIAGDWHDHAATAGLRLAF
jgi:hypothetical protein